MKKEYPDTPEGHHQKNNDSGRNGKFRPNDIVIVDEAFYKVIGLRWLHDSEKFIVSGVCLYPLTDVGKAGIFFEEEAKLSNQLAVKRKVNEESKKSK